MLGSCVDVHVCPAIAPGGVWGRIEVWHRKARCGLRIPLPEHTGHSLLWHPKSRSRTINGGSTVNVVHQLDSLVWHCSATRQCATCLWIGLSKIISARRRRRVDIRMNEFFPIPFLYQSTH
jgi:hypothetical protein